MDTGVIARVAIFRVVHVQLSQTGIPYIKLTVRGRDTIYDEKTLSLYAKTAPEESVCYSMQAKS